MGAPDINFQVPGRLRHVGFDEAKEGMRIEMVPPGCASDPVRTTCTVHRQPDPYHWLVRWDQESALAFRDPQGLEEWGHIDPIDKDWWNGEGDPVTYDSDESLHQLMKRTMRPTVLCFYRNNCSPSLHMVKQLDALSADTLYAERANYVICNTSVAAAIDFAEKHRGSL